MRIRGGKQNLVGVVKEVAPTAQAANDTVLGARPARRGVVDRPRTGRGGAAAAA